MTELFFQGKKPQDWLLAISALILFTSPWTLGFTSDVRPAWNAWISAIVLAYLAFASLSESKQWEEWVTLALGAWLIGAAWVLGFSADVVATRIHWLIGAMTVVFSLWAEWSFRHPPRPMA
ncbi:SPW repeat protein [Labrys okinawensis]|uniref:SPW repeat protein n=1 Tax=Labrys okinawensis TaxID=346911 RepID=UPI0039BC5C95